MIENRSDQMLNLDPCSLCGSQGTRVRAPGTGRCGLLAGRTGRTGFFHHPRRLFELGILPGRCFSLERR